ncbi:hypothetical protein A6R68_00282 [Neotoma lepida]|uniref:Large ribosomal subunit protein eL38 n=1 Tax=Neotoma lepida TaxID=56216 RepID=A0A1A6GXU9_NEOLE|nr:hypothetical protein A6R68_00282 [Neotoma lepida]
MRKETLYSIPLLGGFNCPEAEVSFFFRPLRSRRCECFGCGLQRRASVAMPRKIEEIKDFLLTARRKDAKCLAVKELK